jgi:chromosome partitioning protein
MMILALLAQKGGCGKSTLARALAVAALQEQRRTVLVDADPQETVVKWGRRRTFPAPTVIAVGGRSLADVLDQVEAARPDLVIIDTPPHLRAVVSVAAARANAALLPCRPTPEDLEALGDTADLVRDRPAGIVFNGVPAKGGALTLARAGVAALNLPCAPVAVIERVSHPYASAEGLTVLEREPGSKVAAEITELWAWVRDSLLTAPEHIKMPV